VCFGILASRTDGSEPARLSTLVAIALHLVPGIVVVAFLLVLYGLFARHGLTIFLRLA
jgi:hypothetical protein